jgi:hypothetical protein
VQKLDREHSRHQRVEPVGKLRRGTLSGSHQVAAGPMPRCALSEDIMRAGQMSIDDDIYQQPEPLK